jgi:[glutamine synthetase] adenylyltransferase / [glutamine synthetase]-adenylyl-L-tyrosine phosphorylase
MAKLNAESLSIKTITSNQDGLPRLNKPEFSHCQKLFEIRQLDDYSQAELNEASAWPAIARYLQIVQREGTSVGAQLRLRRHHLWLEAALATYFSPFEDWEKSKAICRAACQHWSDAADSLIREAWNISGCETAGLGLLALGKLGARELNLSSDVDLIMVRPDDVAPDMRAFREFQNLLSENTEFGFCLRTDFTIRPGGRSSAAIPSLADFEYHYGYHGEMWERLAFVRMRLLEGPQALREGVQTFVQKFSFRKHLDYTLIDELKVLRSKIRAEKYDRLPNVFNLKLGEGGIRELELFVHSLQIIHGGRNPLLRTNSTAEAIHKIAQLQLLPSSDCHTLDSSYWHLRAIENRLQAFEDQQTYDVDLVRIHPGLTQELVFNLTSVRKQISEVTGSFFKTQATPSATESNDNSVSEIVSATIDSLPNDLAEQKDWLKHLGFDQSSQDDTWPNLIAATAISRRSQADEKQRLEFLEGFVIKLSKSRLDKDLGLSLLLDFVRSVRAKASFFTLLNKEPRARDELALLFSISPYLSSLLISRPELIDEFVYRRQAPLSQDFGTLLEELAERRLMSELISANQFLVDRDLGKLNLNLSATADSICTTLLERLNTELNAQKIGIISLGKWGGRELGLRSDLDFIFVTEQAPTAEEHKVAKRFLARLNEAHRGGSIYSVDMRLRPSGHSGPIITSQTDLLEYLKNKAATWERQAYLRARPLYSLPFSIGEIVSSRKLSQENVDELKSIRKQLFRQPQIDEVDLKLTLGGLADVEFTAQIALLYRQEYSLDPSTHGMILHLEDRVPCWAEFGPELRKQYNELRVIEQLFQLTTSQSGSKIRIRTDEFRRLALVLDSTPDQLAVHVKNLFTSIEQLLRKVSDLDLAA